MYDVITWETSNCNTHIAQYLKKKSNETMKFGQFIEYNTRNVFLEKSNTKCDEETIPRPFAKKKKIEHISQSIV